MQRQWRTSPRRWQPIWLEWKWALRGVPTSVKKARSEIYKKYKKAIKHGYHNITDRFERDLTFRRHMVANGHSFDTMRSWDLMARANLDRHEVGQGVEEMSYRERQAANLWTATAQIMSTDRRHRLATGESDRRSNYGGASWQWKCEDWMHNRRR